MDGFTSLSLEQMKMKNFEKDFSDVLNFLLEDDYGIFEFTDSRGVLGFLAEWAGREWPEIGQKIRSILENVKDNDYGVKQNVSINEGMRRGR